MVPSSWQTDGPITMANDTHSSSDQQLVQAVRETPVGSARGSPTVEHHPVRDSVTAVARVVRPVEATPDFCGELSLLIGITGRTVSPCGRTTEAKTKLNALLADVERTGASVTITKHGRPVAVLSGRQTRFRKV